MTIVGEMTDPDGSRDQGRGREPRIGVLVVAYNAVSDAGPGRSTGSRRTSAAAIDEILVCDDASRDDTYLVGAGAISSRRRSCRSRSSATRENLGYGGNQKAGYRWAIEHGLDIVVLLHGDGQYAPECSRDSSSRWSSGEADAVFGSRMMEPRAAPRRRHAAVQVRRQPDPHARSRTRLPGSSSPSGTPATAPTASPR